MKTPLPFKLIAICCIVLGLSISSLQAVQQSSDVNESQASRRAISQSLVNSLALTPAEKKWLEAHPVIHLGGGPFPPFDFKDDTGAHIGICILCAYTHI